jgi:hypothetical protein
MIQTQTVHAQAKQSETGIEAVYQEFSITTILIEV